MRATIRLAQAAIIALLAGTGALLLHYTDQMPDGDPFVPGLWTAYAAVAVVTLVAAIATDEEERS